MIAVTPVANYGAGIAAAVGRDQIYRLEAALRSMPQTDCPVRNLFAAGLYMREMTLPAGTVIVGAVHKTEHVTIISKGRVQVVRPDGMEEFTAPATFVSQPGAKNAVHVIEDSVWTTIHANPGDERDIDVLVERFTTSKNSELMGGADNMQVLENARSAQIKGA